MLALLKTTRDFLSGQASAVDRRRQERHRFPYLAMRIEGRRYAASDWSLGGFRLPDFHRVLALHETVEGTIGRLGPSAPGGFLAEIVRMSAENGVGFRFLEIAPSSFFALGGFDKMGIILRR